MFDSKDQQSGLNYPPAHPNYRCTICGYFPPDEIDAAFEKYREDGIELVEGLTFDEWYRSLKEKDGKKIFDENIAKDLKNSDKYDIINSSGKSEWNIKHIPIQAKKKEKIVKYSTIFCHTEKYFYKSKYFSQLIFENPADSAAFCEFMLSPAAQYVMYSICGILKICSANATMFDTAYPFFR